jgi:SAM-dependent methyltransferase
MSFLLSRTCDLTDFPNLKTVSDWQQALAERAWTEWQQGNHVRTREQSLCVNWLKVPFIAPGPKAIYEYPPTPTKVLRIVPAVWGLRVLDHTDAPLRFLTRAAQLLRPGGLLFLTFAFWDAEGEDVAEGNGERTRIYDATSLMKLVNEARRIGFQAFGGIDWTYHGDKLGDHSLASLVLTRRDKEIET